MTSVPWRMRASTKTSAPVSVRVVVEADGVVIVDTIKVPQTKQVDPDAVRSENCSTAPLSALISLYTQIARFESSFGFATRAAGT